MEESCHKTSPASRCWICSRQKTRHEIPNNQLPLADSRRRRKKRHLYLRLLAGGMSHNEGFTFKFANKRQVMHTVFVFPSSPCRDRQTVSLSTPSVWLSRITISPVLEVEWRSVCPRKVSFFLQIGGADPHLCEAIYLTYAHQGFGKYRVLLWTSNFGQAAVVNIATIILRLRPCQHVVLHYEVFDHIFADIELYKKKGEEKDKIKEEDAKKERVADPVGRGGGGGAPIWKGQGCSSYRLGVKISSSGTA